MQLDSNRLSTGENHSRSKAFFVVPGHLPGRIGLLLAILAVDGLARAKFPHSDSLLGPFAAFGIVFLAVFLGLGFGRLKAEREAFPFDWRFLAAHLVCFVLFSLAGLTSFSERWPWLEGEAAGAASRVMLLLGVWFLGLACLPARGWARAVRVTGRLWLYASLAGLLAWCLRYPLQSAWTASGSIKSTEPIPGSGQLIQIVTFRSVGWVLGHCLPGVQVNLTDFSIGTPKFTVIIAQACSGVEGLGLVLVFTAVWLWYCRKETRFPRALVLIPCALAAVWLLNILRIAALVWIGSAGAPDVAMIGFHSQAGWIAFTAVALCFSLAAQRIAWFRRVPAGAASTGLAGSAWLDVGREAASPVAAYLVPFLAILAASFVAKAASGAFEWLYPLRFVAAVAALWYFRAEYRTLRWRFGWQGPVTGLAVFGIWLAPAFWGLWHGSAAAVSSLGASLAALTPAGRLTWIAFRVVAATVTVPIAEELAFRGFLARRLVAAEFERVPFQGLTVAAIGVSSVAFGMMHGASWLVGILAGLAYAGVARWRGRLGDAVVAHATTNLLLAVWVLARGDWAQW